MKLRCGRGVSVPPSLGTPPYLSRRAARTQPSLDTKQYLYRRGARTQANWWQEAEFYNTILYIILCDTILLPDIPLPPTQANGGRRQSSTILYYVYYFTIISPDTPLLPTQANGRQEAEFYIDVSSREREREVVQLFYMSSSSNSSSSSSIAEVV